MNRIHGVNNNFRDSARRPLDKLLKIGNNIRVGREPLSFSRIKDSSSHPTVYNFSAITATPNASNSIIICLTIAQPSFRPISS